MVRGTAGRRAGLVAVVVAGEIGVATTAGRSSAVAVLLAVAVVGLISVVAVPWFVPVAVVPGVWMLFRVGPASLDMSMSDALLIAGLLVAVGRVPWGPPPVRRALVVVAAYLGLLAVAIAAHPTQRATIEWGHRAFLVGGSILVGAAIAASGRVSTALRLFLAVSFVFGAAAVVEGVSSGFEPAYPFGMQKNAAGGLFVMALVTVVAAPTLAKVGGATRGALTVVLLGALLATQSRGAAIALVVVALLVGLQRGRRPGVRFVAVLSAVAAIALVVATFDDIGIADKGNRFNSYNSRRLTNEYAIDRWRESPLTGIGLKFFRDPGFYTDARSQGETTFGEPHNMIVANLAESGVIGSAALVVLLVGLARVLRRRRSELASLALTLLFVRVVNAQFDIWWVAGTLTLPFTVAGMALGVPQTDRRSPTEAAVSASALPIA